MNEHTISTALTCFLENAELSVRSRKTYRYSLQTKFFGFLILKGILPDRTPVSAITLDHIEQFAQNIFSDQSKTDLQQNSARVAMSATRKFLAYLHAEEMTTISPEDVYQRLRGIIPPPSPQPPEVDIEALKTLIDFVLALPRQWTPSLELRRLKLQAMFLFLWDTGVKLHELIALRRGDFRFTTTGGEAGITNSHAKRRTVTFTRRTAEALSKYWEFRQITSLDEPAFSGRDRIGTTEKSISPRTVEYFVSELSKEAGVKDITPSSFRHALAFRMMRRRLRPDFIQERLGHASRQHTRLYEQCLKNTDDHGPVFDD